MAVTLTALYEILHQRRRPELLLPLLQRLTPAQTATLRRAAAHLLRRNEWQYSAMASTFRTLVGADRQMQKAAELFQLGAVPTTLRGEVPAEVEQFLHQINSLLNKPAGHHNYRTDRLDRAARAAAGLDLSKRQYNKRFRAIRHLEEKLEIMRQEERKLEFELIAKHGLVHQLDYDVLQ